MNTVKQLKKQKTVFLVSNLALAAAAAAAALILCISCLTVTRIHGDGMQPALHDGGTAVFDRVAYRMRTPKRGDVVLAGGHVLRVIGLPGETITLWGGEIFADGILLTEPYLSATVLTWPVEDRNSFQLKEHEYFLLCDNRDCYDDSRSGRIYTDEEILAKAIFGT